MEEFKKRSAADGDKEIVFSKAIKAGKRIYYLDVKKNRKDEMFLAITESKKIVSGEGDDSQISFEKHKIFLYREDFSNFIDGLSKTIRFIQEATVKQEEKNTETEEATDSNQSQENIVSVEKDSNVEDEFNFDF